VGWWLECWAGRAYHESPGHAVTALIASNSCEQDVAGSAMASSTPCGTMAREWPRKHIAMATMIDRMMGIRIGREQTVEKGKTQAETDAGGRYVY